MRKSLVAALVSVSLLAGIGIGQQTARAPQGVPGRIQLQGGQVCREYDQTNAPVQPAMATLQHKTAVMVWVACTNGN